ncbi:SEC-C metal-binding domain-containing protein [uncultured Sphingorhabdus sp.]|uniref:SEC-C metal-binding domain-containing protein n=1 Tax=uncultured Sphingorhabdus sp. TaxID=1686106 RepID=UPI0026017FCB|nr:SEC-C metal-binding domain-containing protein [uncultured Sphingorhabdus sp.]HMS21314.1 SEC-C metal-binding domain-containing protein [Sphingorhabdus sp.]
MSSKKRKRAESKRFGRQHVHDKTKPQSASRTEAEIFADIRSLAQSPGFIHALAALVFKSNVVTAIDEFTVEDFQKIYEPDRLLRTETNLLIGLMLSGKVDSRIPELGLLKNYTDRAVSLLHELHQALVAAGHEHFSSAMRTGPSLDADQKNPMGSGTILREAIFYGGESAFSFQYEALARERYAADRQWLQTNKGFDIDEAATVLTAIRRIVDSNFPKIQAAIRSQHPSQWTYLPLFTFTLDEIIEQTGMEIEKVNKIIDSFSVLENDKELSNYDFGKYNKASSHPILILSNGTMISFLEYATLAALYENPFYWITSDKKYLGIHSQYRGQFTEHFTEKTLLRVFPNKYVFKNVIFKDLSGNIIGEADAILIYGFRAFVVQAKSKRLTLASWHGDDDSIAKDFQAAVQEGYDQAIECIQHIKNCMAAFTEDGPIDFHQQGNIREYYPICISSEHYPALAFQSEIFLKLTNIPGICNPLVTDIFTLEVISEFLSSPLYFTDYLVKRSSSAGKLYMSHELIALSWYIKKNLHIEQNEFFALADDISLEIDLAMAVRKQGISGPATPKGQLTRFKNTPAGIILEHVESSERPEVHRLGETILGMSSATADEFNKGIGRVIQMTSLDSGQHDITMGLEGGGGITVHCNRQPQNEAKDALTYHCEMRKYVTKSDRWYGVSVAEDGTPRFMIGFDFPWKFEQRLEEHAAPFRVRTVTHSLYGRKKIGRNEKCPCGSGKKYKNCCIEQ